MLHFLNTYIPDSVAFSIFGINVMWYGILIACGMLCATLMAYYRAPRHGIEKDRLLDGVLIGIPMGVLGARLYYVIFSWDYYSQHLSQILNIRGGGLAIHGGLIFGLGTAAFLCHLWKINPLNALDLVVPGVAMAQAIGRWGNYFNQEAHGGPTDLPWAIPVDGQMVHPTFLYESIWCFLLCFLLLYVDRRRSFDGQVVCIYGILYSLERILVESLRTDSLMIGPFRQAQLFSAAVILVCIIAYALLRRRHRKSAKELNA